jgi:outer membrane protein assembly factor BamE (lipoprotein component of BamABCDE complex)
MRNVIVVVFLSIFITNCAIPMSNRAVADSNDFTLGKVQSQLTKGMSAAEVVSLFGSPNLVTSTKDGGESWTYDKISQESEASSRSGMGAGSSGNFFGFLTGGKAKSSRESKNLTLMIKFDSNDTVTDFKYQSVKY